MSAEFNNRIRQVFLLLVITALAILLFFKLAVFFPGFLGAITIYILSRDAYTRMISHRKWRRGTSAIVFMLLFLLCLGVPVYLAVDLLSSRINMLFANQAQVAASLKGISVQLQQWTGQELLSDANIAQIQKAIMGYIPHLVNSTMTVLANLGMMFFLVYFMFVNWEFMEKSIHGFIPLESRNIGILASQTKNMVRANAIGIPLISIIQGAFATIGYWIFGIHDFVMWGFVTGMFAFFPLIGTTMIWAPLVIYTFSTGNTSHAIGLLIYSLLVTGNMGYFTRITVLRKIGNVHPLITVLGVIVGLQLFGFWGFIFGPLLVSYFLLLVRIYANEFGSFKA
ncbi:MAG: AI-2E family transporter [Chitinophagaceae bacterium]|nr:AI-2E family transporter [Chitinophagaceae bacterium]